MRQPGAHLYDIKGRPMKSDGTRWLAVFFWFTSVFAGEPVAQTGHFEECPNQPVTAVTLCAAPAQGQQAPSLPTPKDVGDPTVLGQGIQRTMALLKTSTSQQPNTVRILFYGQSITEQNWWKTVGDDLQRRYPHANLIIENRALGGFASQRLVKTAETDLYPFYPDLMIFHVLGSHLEYENVIRRTRERTTAEILMQTDHVTADANLTEETDPSKLFPTSLTWNSFMNYRFLPETARKYGCGLVDQRNLWKKYLRDNHLAAPRLLSDEVHLNDHGDFLMAELVKAYMISRPDEQLDPLHCDSVKTFQVDKDIGWEGGKLLLPFDGNRVDVILRQGGGTPAGILIDGKRPSEFPELYGFTRALAKPGGKWPVVTNLKFAKPPILEEWTMQVKQDPADEQVFTFALTGSRTGPDGEGRSDQRFVSHSGRVVLEPENWDVAYALELAGVKAMPAEFTVSWQVTPFFADTVEPVGTTAPSVEMAVTVAQGLTGFHHTLEIFGGPDTRIAAVRVYKPPLLIKRD